MPIDKTDAIVLKQKNFMESDKLITVYSKDFGKFDAIVKGIRKSKKRQISNIEPGSYINIVFYNKTQQGYSYIKETSIKNPFLFLRNDIDTLSMLLYILDLTDNLIKEINVANESIFNLLINTILLMKTDHLELVSRFFELRLLKLCGYELIFDRCSSCGSNLKQKVYYDFLKNSIYCRKCIQHKNDKYELNEIDIILLNRINSMSAMDIENAPELGDEGLKIRDFLNKYIAHILGYEMSSQRIISEIMR